MNPGAFVDELGVGQVVANVGIPISTEGDVGGSALEVVASLCASHCLVEGRGAVAAVDADGDIEVLAQWFEDVLAEGAQIVDDATVLSVGLVERVVDASG